jgi:hypothetical protein
MTGLLWIHFAGLILWFGTAAADVVLELVLQRTKTRDGQRALVRLHRTVDLVVEAPAAIVVVFSGVGLLHATGRFDGAGIPTWLGAKIACGFAAAATNLICAHFVVLRARAFDAVPPGEDAWSTPGVRKWNRAVFATGLGIPFAIAAFWLAFANGRGSL